MKILALCAFAGSASTLRRTLAACLVALLATSALADDPIRTQDKNIYWGDLHIHTSYSMDAYVLYNRTTPADAYRFARGGEVELPGGIRHQLRRPLDFAAVTDHAEYFGLMQVCRDQPALPYCRDLAEVSKEDSTRGFMEFFLPTLLTGNRNCQVGADDCSAAESRVWQRTIAAAQAANRPGEFTAFVANEWTASPGNLHWHRNLIYATDNVPERAINSFDQPTQEALWRALRDQCRVRAGCDVTAIPHNGNLSMGGSFTIDPTDAEAPSLRAEFERLVEIHQHKGASECYPQSPLSDEDCDFEVIIPIPLRNQLRANPRELTAKEEQDIASGYVRENLARGLVLDAQSGTNPFRYGFVGATDSHSGRPGDVAEQNWGGALGQWDDDAAGRRVYPQYNPGGLTAVWAPENTRAALFAALQRREVYATSGPRIRLKFGQLVADGASCAQPGEHWVPMGGTLEHKAAEQGPHFFVQTQMDAVPLERIDIIKLFVRDGELEQSIASVPLSDPKSSCVRWRDADYRPTEYALWYVRVLERPTPRWDGSGPIQERAWSSPIWATP